MDRAKLAKSSTGLGDALPMGEPLGVQGEGDSKKRLHAKRGARDDSLAGFGSVRTEPVWVQVDCPALNNS
jgi:hypothetical protein